ncbi:MAG: hypothetical protein JNM75_03125 [Rhodospirillales bacterium]|nr:hypothetical protein [Rhodospirillales bacterium]
MISVFAAAVVLSGCVAQKEAKEVKAAEVAPINCATAEGDIRMLRAEKANVEERIAEGVVSIVPVGFLVGVATQTEGDRIDMASGDYNQILSNEIAKIKSKCKVK